eukprot:CAMPEP_0197532648 /NCGR_PEP_ID=MMETSP1318-20131121/40480_1 /TAXON_ID=552666 /ORGANISM="Partenskyella glossopodia, Strain RCC365" /LENGTH=491 /DNA_ID=CAMNT_0043089283 /DNA_START=381 /DNA_END=1853 /DNA_ORIENTATION=+
MTTSLLGIVIHTIGSKLRWLPRYHEQKGPRDDQGNIATDTILPDIVLAMIQGSVLMQSLGPLAIILTWATFAQAQILVVYWALRFYGLDEASKTYFKRAISQVRLPRFGKKGLRLMLVAWLPMIVFTMWHSFKVSDWQNTVQHDERYFPSRLLLAPGAASAAQRAENYFRSQIPYIQTSLQSTFSLHPYFAKTKLWKGIRLHEYYNQRIKAFQVELNEGHTGFMIEKDKCMLFDFLKNNGLPLPEVLGIFREQKDLEEKLRYLSVAGKRKQGFPVFIKACHLTQGGDKGTIPAWESNITSYQTQIMPWVERKWAQRPRDDGRPWTTEMNQLLSNLAPGVAIQGPFNGIFISPDHTPLEVKIEVLWGRAYLGLFGDYHDIIALRTGVYEYTNRDHNSNSYWTLENKRDKRLEWLNDVGHMDAAWELAERVALAIGIDEVRVDIFIDPLRPERPVVNEISLSSGHDYLYHSPYLSQIVAGPHLAKEKQEVSFW